MIQNLDNKLRNYGMYPQRFYKVLQFMFLHKQTIRRRRTPFHVNHTNTITVSRILSCIWCFLSATYLYIKQWQSTISTASSVGNWLLLLAFVKHNTICISLYPSISITNLSKSITNVILCSLSLIVKALI